jgi:signal transduction histidine kinase
VISWPERGSPLLEESDSGLAGVGWLLPVGMLGVGAGALASFVSLGVRVRRSHGEERQQLWWFLWAMAVSLAAIVAAFLVTVPDRPPVVRDLLLGVAVVTVPVATGVAILRYRLYDIQLLVNRTLVYGGLTAVVFSIYVTTVTLTGRLVQDVTDWQIALPATAVVAVIVLPLRARLQTWVNRLMYGDRDDPYGVLARLGQHLESVRLPGDTLTGLVATVASALRLPYVAVHLEVDAATPPVAAWGSPPARATVFPLTYRGATVGSLAVGGRESGGQLAPRDRELLEALAAQAGVAVHAERLTLDLQRSRQQLVTAREEERRRPRRDLHDGLAPTLAGVALGVEAAGNLLDRSPDAAAALLSPVRDQVKAALDDIRRLVEGLRPPALDELGLLDALRAQAMRFDALAARGGDELRITVVGCEELPQLPAAVETAAYRIALEAMTNAVRHAHAQRCWVRVTCRAGVDLVEVEVTDDGRGLADRPTGVGTASMRERAGELGGTCTVQTRPGGGTRVLAQLPVPT